MSFAHLMLACHCLPRSRLSLLSLPSPIEIAMRCNRSNVDWLRAASAVKRLKRLVSLGHAWQPHQQPLVHWLFLALLPLIVCVALTSAEPVQTSIAPSERFYCPCAATENAGTAHYFSLLRNNSLLVLCLVAERSEMWLSPAAGDGTLRLSEPRPDSGLPAAALMDETTGDVYLASPGDEDDGGDTLRMLRADGTILPLLTAQQCGLITPASSGCRAVLPMRTSCS